MSVWINGDRRELTPGACVLDIVDMLGVPRSGVAVAIDDTVVPRAEWASRVLSEGARVEVLTAVQGG